MFSALFSFLGGTAFRMIFGEVSAYFQKKQDKEAELELMKCQAELDLARHQQDIEKLKVQSELGIKEVTVKGDIDIEKIDASAFVEAMKEANKPTGIKWVDAWNGVIRPLAATIAIVLWVFALNQAGFVMSDWDKELVAVIFGFFFANREMTKRGK